MLQERIDARLGRPRLSVNCDDVQAVETLPNGQELQHCACWASIRASPSLVVATNSGSKWGEDPVDRFARAFSFYSLPSLRCQRLAMLPVLS